MAKAKQSFYTASVRLSESEHQKLLQLASQSSLSQSEFMRHAIFHTRENKRPSQPIINKKDHAQILALLGKSRLFTNINQMVHAMHCGHFFVDEAFQKTIHELHSDLKFIRTKLLHDLGKKAPRE